MPAADPVRAELETLHALVERVLGEQRRLVEQARTLHQAQEQLSSERSSLIARNETARTRIEAMIQRLRALENPTRG